MASRYGTEAARRKASNDTRMASAQKIEGLGCIYVLPTEGRAAKFRADAL